MNKSRRKQPHLFNETMLQRAIVDTLVLAGFSVKHTSAFLQKGPSGVSKGIPDLLVSHRAIPHRYVGMEVKMPNGKLTPEQQQAVLMGEYIVVRSPEEATRAAFTFLTGGDHLPNPSETDIATVQRVLRSLKD